MESLPDRRRVLQGLIATGVAAAAGASATACSSDAQVGHSGEAGTRTSDTTETDSATNEPLVATDGASVGPGFTEVPTGLIQTDNSGRVYALHRGALTRWQKLPVAGAQGERSRFVWEVTGKVTTGWDYEQMITLGSGVLIGRAPQGTLHWHRDLSTGRDDLRWSINDGIEIAQGWQLAHLINLHSGHIIAVDPDGSAWWHQWLGDRWHPASGSLQIASDWRYDDLAGAGAVVYGSAGSTVVGHRVAIDSFVAPDQQPRISIRSFELDMPLDDATRLFSTGNGVIYTGGVGGADPAWSVRQHALDGSWLNEPADSGLALDPAAVIAAQAPALVEDMAVPKGHSAARLDAYWIDQSIPTGSTHAQLALSASTPTDDLQAATLVRLGDGQRWPLGVPEATNQGVRSGAAAIGCGWDAQNIELPADVTTDLFAVEIETSSASLWVPFVIRPQGPPTASLAVLANTNTWNAYNAWSGVSQYTNPFATQLSFHRPDRQLDPNQVLRDDLDAPAHHLVAGEAQLLRWLTNEGVGYDLFSDLDLHDGILDLGAYQALLIHSHPEYWSNEMFDAVVAYLDNDGTLINLGGNCLYERISYTSDRAAMILRNGEPESDRDLLRGNDRPERPVLGVAFEGTWYEGDPPGLQKGSAAGRFAPYRAADTGHRFFDGTGIAAGDLFVTVDGDTGGAGWEVDTSHNDGHPESAGEAPDNIQVLARGVLGERPGEQGLWTPDFNAHMTYYDHPGGGWVFSAGSLVFTHWMVQDERAQQLIRNVISDALG